MRKQRRTSPLPRREQLRLAKRAQRERERKAGLHAVELRLPKSQAERLRAALRRPLFRKAFEELLDDQIIDIAKWPALRDLAWNRTSRWIAAEDALALYERNWRFVSADSLVAAEKELIERLKQRFGNGLLNA